MKRCVLAVLAICFSLGTAHAQFENFDADVNLTIETLMSDLNSAWESRHQIREALLRKDLALGLKTSQDYIKTQVHKILSVTDSAGRSRVERMKRDPSSTLNAFISLNRRIVRSKELIAILTADNVTNPKKFHEAFKELIEIGKTHQSLQFEYVVYWQVHRAKLCAATLKKAG